MWQQMNGQPMVTKISKQWTSNISMVLGIILLLGFLGIIGDTNAASIQTAETNKTQPASPSNSTNLKAKLELFQAKYSATLLNSTLLPFTKDCSQVFDKSPEKMSGMDRLCITYYDTINSIYQLNEFENAESVTEILKKYNESSITKNFCSEFPGEIAARLEKQPFAEAKNITNWLDSNECVVSCMIRDSKWRILDICKLISGSLSMAVNKSKIEAEGLSPKTKEETSTQKNNSINNGTNPINDQKITAVTQNQEVISADKPTKTQEQQNTIGTMQEAPKIDEPVQSNEEDKQLLKDPIAGDGEDSEQNNETKIESESKNYENVDNDVDIADEAENHIEDGPNETPVEKNSNSLLSPLSANINDFREDNESSFFSYFMFLSFLIIIFYVAYHNKSKILALLIEGRRGRTYSRGGSRRKSHSAEYRKLDCNLEEAIQSGGSQTLSSQIIY